MSPDYRPQQIASLKQQIGFHQQRREDIEADPTIDNDRKAMELTYHDKIIEHLQEQVTSLERQLRPAR
jgi:hypothetical protein